MLSSVDKKVYIGEPAFKMGSLFMWNLLGDESPFVVTDASPVGVQQCDADPVVWEWQYRIHYLRCPIKTTFMGETEMKTLIRATELQLISEGDS
jgi:hypothetical protein